MKRLIIRPGAIGDFIVCIPAIECLHTEYLEIWTTSRNVPLAARLAQRARSIASTGLDLLEVTGPSERLLESLRGFDSIVSWYGSNRAEFRNAVEGLRLPFRFLDALPDGAHGVHATDFYLQQVRAMAPCASNGIPCIPCATVRGDTAIIHPFAGSPRKRWPLDRFQELARRLSACMPVEWCAGPEDQHAGARRFENLYDLACWLATARIYVGNDSGPTHLAAAVGTPVVAVFASSNVGLWSPRGPHVFIAAAPVLESVTVDQVEVLVQKALVKPPL